MISEVGYIAPHNQCRGVLPHDDRGNLPQAECSGITPPRDLSAGMGVKPSINEDTEAPCFLARFLWANKVSSPTDDRPHIVVSGPREGECYMDGRRAQRPVVQLSPTSDYPFPWHSPSYFFNPLLSELHRRNGLNARWSRWPSQNVTFMIQSALIRESVFTSLFKKERFAASIPSDGMDHGYHVAGAG